MSTLRRSERLAPKLVVKYMAQYIKIEKKIKKLTEFTTQASTSFMDPEKKIKLLSNLVIFLTKNFDMIELYGNKKYDIMFKTLYEKSFIWIKEAKENYIENVEEIIKAFNKFRKKYELSRYNKWEFLKVQFNLDANIMFRIDSYM